MATKVTKIKWLTQVDFQAFKHVEFLSLQLRKVADLSVVLSVDFIKILIGLQEVEHLTGSLLHKWRSQRQTGGLLADCGPTGDLLGRTECRY